MTTPTVRTVSEVRSAVADARRAGATVGLVPTMGALHEGHVSLVRRAVSECGFVVVSIFVNPLQFGADEDLAAYPRDLDGDVAACASAGAHLVFAPTVSDVYPRPVATTVSVAGVSEGLCGEERPGHFDGVATVVAKLLNIVGPDRAYFGRKDAQQLAVISRMVDDLNFAVEIVPCPTVREADGLAMSSRNKYLDDDGHRAALAIHRGLLSASALAESGEVGAEALAGAVRRELDAEPAVSTEYVELRDAGTIDAIDRLPAEGRAILAVAARVETPGGAARLIDNFVFEISGGEMAIDEGALATGSGLAATS